MKRGTNRTKAVRPRSIKGRRPAFVLVLVAGLLLYNAFTFAEGFRNPPAGALNLGRSGGRIAQVDDSTAAAQNPANLVDLKASELQVTPSVVYISADFQSPTGQTARSEDPWKVLPNAFAGMPLADGQFGLGIAATMPYGLGSKWDQDSSAFARPFGQWRYQSPFETDLKTININPGVAAKLSENVRFGMGLDVMWSDITLKQFYPWFLATGNLNNPDGNIEASGSGIGVGGNFGLTVKLAERHRLALTYRMPITVNYDGDFTVDNVPAVLGGGKHRSDFNTSIKFPAIVAAGYGFKVTDTIRLEADIEWLQFSNFKHLPLNVAAPLPGLPTAVAENWRDTITIGIGGDWRFASNWLFRAGYQYYQSPVPDSTFSAAIPDANQNVITVALAYQYKHHSLEAAYGADFYDSRNISNNQNPVFNGKYNINVHLFSFSYRFSF